MRVDTVVVGGGAAGLAAAWHLRARNRRFVVLEASRPGSVWRRRYDSLRLFTPARFCALPGLPFPLPPGEHPGKDEMAAYLTHYVRHHDLPLRAGVTVVQHRYAATRHRLTTTAGDEYEADRLIVATGALRTPVVPSFAASLDPAVRQLHSAGYRRPSDVPPGPVLVVGAGPAGADIALDLVGDHEVWLAGPRTGHVPLRVVRSRLIRRLGYTRRVPPGLAGRLIRDRVVHHGSPLIWQTEAMLRQAGIHRVARVAGVRDGRPELDDGRLLDAATVVWCTGMRPDHRWLDPRALTPNGRPAHRRGISTTVPGLGFVGLPLQNTFGSGFLAGMDGDAAYVVGRQS
ncbi:flavin-containing monooxygenase [Actinoplanes solisilvae]|uniref:flavin-containing monooxygenase n=1 Tax=Actinoplanes solisilvae TaxID=2486853 RepID=UPI000FD935CA|nr:FAD-dependent oxidoreductase [Actinoplanes solisilvae]